MKEELFGLLEFVAAIFIAGFLYSPGPRLVDSLGALLRRMLSDRSEQMMQLVHYRLNLGNIEKYAGFPNIVLPTAPSSTNTPSGLPITW